MGIDNDLSALLPDPPSPRPARREAAIAEALRRFDGTSGVAPVAPARTRPAAARPWWARPQVATFASAVLVVLIAVPIFWTGKDRIAPDAPHAPAPVVQRAPVVPPAPGRPAAPPPDAAGPTPAAPPPLPAGIASQDTANVAERAPPEPAQRAEVQALPQAPASAQPPAPVVATAPARRQSAAAQAAREAEEEGEDDSDSAIVVTGSYVQRGDSAARAPIPSVADAAPLDGEWNACTLHDPRRNPTRCRDSGRAAAQLDDGLTLAWGGELDRAIRAFDRAIAAEPDFALAYLNRGLAWQAKGDLPRALADLNRAVARDRNSARGYYHRSLLHRARGDAARADADARRAIELDPAYRAVLP